MMLNGLITVNYFFYNFFTEQLNDFLYAYEDSNLKTYADSKFENFLLFKHPLKTDSKD